MKNYTKFHPNYEKVLDEHFESLIKNEQLSVPGLVVLARRGGDARRDEAEIGPDARALQGSLAVLRQPRRGGGAAHREATEPVL